MTPKPDRTPSAANVHTDSTDLHTCGDSASAASNSLLQGDSAATICPTCERPWSEHTKGLPGFVPICPPQADRTPSAAQTLELIEREPEKLTERDMLERLRSRYSGRAGNGPRWAFASHVRDRAGFDATRTLDAVAMDTWPSSGLALHGFEIKVSRADWRRELTQPEKAEAFIRFLDYFWIAAPRYVVKREELPEGWGLIETRNGGLVASVQAQRRDPKPLVPEPVDRSFVACLMRSACRA